MATLAMVSAPGVFIAPSAHAAPPRERVAHAARSTAETYGPSTLAQGVTGADGFRFRVVTTGLEAPWEVAVGADRRLWITERVGKRVVRVDPETGTRTTALSLPSAVRAGGQDGLLGLALNPGLGTGSGRDFVYLAYTYDADAGRRVVPRIRIARYTLDSRTQTLTTPVVVLENLPASDDHNGGRLAYGPDDKLYYTIGDQGHNQYDNACAPNHAQRLPTAREVAAADWSAYHGKILRLNLDGSIPADNPLLSGARSHVFSYGHRNPQGVTFGANGQVYASEHGPKSDDELNLIESGKNYGWPHVAGYQDDRAYKYANWSEAEDCTDLEFSDYVIPPTVPQEREASFRHPDFRPPLLTLYTVDDGHVFLDPACPGEMDYVCWPTIAPSSIDLYLGGEQGVPGWGRSLLLTSLKFGSVYRVGLNARGDGVLDQGSPLFRTVNRYRDLAVAPDQRTFYVVTDSEGDTSGPTRRATQQLEHRGALLEFRYMP